MTVIAPSTIDNSARVAVAVAADKDNTRAVIVYDYEDRKKRPGVVILRMRRRSKEMLFCVACAMCVQYFNALNW